MKKYSAEVIFVENIRARAEAIKKSGGFVLNLDVRRAVTWLNKHGHKFNYIFADPPYNSGWCEIITSFTGLNDLFFDDEAIFIIEHSAREELKNFGSFELYSQRQYGETILSFLRRAN